MADWFSLISLGVEAVSEVASFAFSTSANNQALQEQEQMIKTQSLDNQYKTLVNKNKTLDQMQISLQKGEAHQAVTGATFNSPTFYASQVNIIQQGDKALRNADTAEALNNYALEMKKREAETHNSNSMISGITGGITEGFSLLSKGVSEYDKKISSKTNKNWWEWM